MKRLGPDVWDDENEEPIRKISDQQIIEDEKLNELQRMVDEANRQFKTNVGDYTGRQQTSEDAWNRALAQEDMDYKRQYAEAMRNADREMENVPLMAEYNTTQRYLDKELGRDPVKRIIMNDRARLGSKVRDLIPEGGMTSSANMSRELDPYQKLIAQKQSLMQPKSTPNVSIQGEGFSEGTNETLRNAVLSTLLAGGAGVAGYGSYKAGSEFAEGFKRGFNRSNSSPIQTFKANEMLDYNPSNRINVDPSVIEAKTSTPLLTQSTPRNARDFSYLNPKAQPIVESPFYKQGIPDEILQNRLGVVPETKIPLQTKQQLPVDRVNPEQIKYNQLQESLKNSPTRGASFSGSPAEYSNVVGKPQLAKEMESKLAKDYFAKQILRGLAGGAKLMRSEVPAISMEEIDPGNEFQKQLDEKIRQIQLKRLGIID